MSMPNFLDPTKIQIPPGLAAIAAGRDFVTTEEAAKTLNRKPQTLRKYACLGTGSIRPVRVNGRLMWRVSDLARLLAGETVGEAA